MRRREFLSVAASAAALPFAARAQTAAVPVIGFLHQGSLGAERRAIGDVPQRAELRPGLSRARTSRSSFAGQTVNSTNCRHWPPNSIQRRVAVITTPFSTDAALAAKAVTSTIPIVFLSSADAVQIGLVASLGRPGGNMTGVTTMNTELAPKRLGLLRDLVPDATRYFALINPDSDSGRRFHQGHRKLPLPASGSAWRSCVRAATASSNPYLRASRRHSRADLQHRRAVLHPPRTDRGAGDTLRRSDDLRRPRLYRSRWVDELFRRTTWT